MHEMLCSHFGSEFDNRMLQVKKQLGIAESFFPLLYSKFLRDGFYGHIQTRTPPTAGHGTPGKVTGRNTTIRQQLLNP
jgi:hypothetical protein